MVEASKDYSKIGLSNSLPNKQPLTFQLQARLLQSLDSNEEVEESKSPE